MTTMWLEGWTVILLLILIQQVWSKKVYLDRYGDCFHGDFFEVEAGDIFTIFSQGGEPYDTSLCEMSFKSIVNDRLCLHFDKFHINTCNVKLAIYSDETSSGRQIGNYDCRTPDIPERVCSDGKFLTIKMTKRMLSHEGYSFEMELREHSNGFDDYFLSIGLIIAIVVGVIVLLVLIACVIVYCCCKSRPYGLIGRRSRKSMSTSGRTQFTDAPREPTAPPLEDPPPAYLDQPPPYTEMVAPPLPSPSAPPVEHKDAPQPV